MGCHVLLWRPRPCSGKHHSFFWENFVGATVRPFCKPSGQGGGSPVVLQASPAWVLQAPPPPVAAQFSLVAGNGERSR